MPTFKPIPILTTAHLARFWAIVDIGKGQECWEWCSYKIRGYGAFRFASGSYLAHRVAKSIYTKIPDSMLVLHKCSNPGYVNPTHLYIGTDADNVAQAIKEGSHISYAGGDDYTGSNG